MLEQVNALLYEPENCKKQRHYFNIHILGIKISKRAQKKNTH